MKHKSRWRTSVLAGYLILLGMLILPGLFGTRADIQAQPNAWVNEFHYDNLGTDANEFIEVVIENPGLYNLADFSLCLYNGIAAGAAVVYNTKSLSEFTVGTTVGNYTFYHYTYPTNGIQNGGNDGFALIYQNALISGQLLSYQGIFTAASGPAAGHNSVDIGVVQSNTTPIGLSLQLSGSGTTYSDFSWDPPAAATKGTVNYNQFFEIPDYCANIQTFWFPQQTSLAVIDTTNAEIYIEVQASTNLSALTANFTLCYAGYAFDMTNQSYNIVESGVTVIDYSDTVYWLVMAGDENSAKEWQIVVKRTPTQVPSIVINEVDYNQASTDNAEFIELKNITSMPVNLLNWRIVLINGDSNPPTGYDTIILPDYVLGPEAYFVICGNTSYVSNCNLEVSAAPTDLIQNGNPDALVLLDPYGGMVDMLSYGGNTPGYTEGSGEGLIDNTNTAHHGLSRIPDGQDTDQNNIDFSFRCITPGESNTNLVGYCGPFHQLHATVYYDNDQNTPLPFIPVSIYLNNALVGTEETDQNGKVSFEDLRNDSYTFVLDPTHYLWGWGGVNSLDALLIAKHFAGMVSLSPFEQLVGDVSTPSGLNSGDALTVAQRFAGILHSFSAGDWYTQQPPLTITGAEDSQIDLGMPIRCYGDVNGTYFPPIKSTGLNILEEGISEIRDKLITLPISLDAGRMLGAISLEIRLPANTQVIDIQMKDNHEAIYHQDGQVLRIAWFSIDGMDVQDRQAFMTMILQVAQGFESKQLQVLPGSELGDVDGQELKNISLIIPHAIGGLVSLRAYPNPATQNLNIDIQLSTDQDVVLSLYNMLGERIITKDLGRQNAGIHHTQLDVTTLSKGSYLIRLQGSEEASSSRITIMR